MGQWRTGLSPIKLGGILALSSHFEIACFIHIPRSMYKEAHALARFGFLSNREEEWYDNLPEWLPDTFPQANVLVALFGLLMKLTLIKKKKTEKEN